MINYTIRYQKGLTLADLYPVKVGCCACGCGNLLPKSRKKWFSDQCRQNAYLNFAVIKGDNTVIRTLLYDRDYGKCANCKKIENKWEADHIISVVEGGGGCLLDNYQTLCIRCHKLKTFQTLSHHKPISSQVSSIFRNRIAVDPGENSMVFKKTSNDAEIFLFGTFNCNISELK